MISGWLGRHTGLKTKHTHTTPFRPRFASRTLSDVERGPKSIEHADAPDLVRSEVHRGSVRTRNVGANPGTIPHERMRGPADASPRCRKNVCAGHFTDVARRRPTDVCAGSPADVCTGGPAERRTHVCGKEPFLRGDVTVAVSGRGRVRFCRWHTPSSLPCFANTLPAESQRRCISLKSCDGQERKPRYHQLPQNTHIKQVQVDR